MATFLMIVLTFCAAYGIFTLGFYVGFKCCGRKFFYFLDEALERCGYSKEQRIQFFEKMKEVIHEENEDE